MANTLRERIELLARNGGVISRADLSVALGLPDALPLQKLQRRAEAYAKARLDIEEAARRLMDNNSTATNVEHQRNEDDLALKRMAADQWRELLAAAACEWSAAQTSSVEPTLLSPTEGYNPPLDVTVSEGSAEGISNASPVNTGGDK